LNFQRQFRSSEEKKKKRKKKKIKKRKKEVAVQNTEYVFASTLESAAYQGYIES